MPTNLNSEVELTRIKANENLKKATNIMFAVAIIGQLLFALYILAFYGGVAISRNYEKVNEALMHGVIEGDRMGNIALGIHILLAGIITIGGPIQFMARIRKRFPKFHRWNGRIYFITAIMISILGMYMIISRGASGGITMFLGNTLNATLITTFSILAWSTAMKRDFVAHKKWALRAFLMVSGVWFFRIGYGIWILITGFTAPGVSPNLDGPFDIFLSFAHSLVPLIILESYFLVKANPNIKLKKISTFLIWILSVLLLAGIGMAAFIFWMPAVT